MLDENVCEKAGVSRREALKRGAVASGALLWTAPVVQALSVDAADAASGGGGGQTPTDPPTTQPPAVQVLVPSHGLLVYYREVQQPSTAGGGGKGDKGAKQKRSATTTTRVLYAAKVDESGEVDRVPDNSNGGGTSQTGGEFLRSQGYSDWKHEPVEGGRIVLADGSVKGLYLVVPAGGIFEGAWTADGKGDAVGLDYTPVSPDASGRVEFHKL